MYGEHLYKVNKDGFPVEYIIAYFDEGNNIITEVDEDVILIPIPQGLYRPKWNSTEWIEDMTQEEIDELNHQSHQPTQEELILQKVIAILPASVLAQGIEEQYQEDLKILNLESEV